jgi:NitT/TauT family transport system substrate-binding protein
MAIRLSENFRALFYAPFYAAHAIGAYDAEGVAVELVHSPDPASAAMALRRGEIDVMWGGPLRVILTHAQDSAADTVCFCDVIARDPFFIIGREPRPEFRVEDLANLRFASVAEVPTPWLCLQDDLRRAGVDPAGLDRVTGSSMADIAAALRAGMLDAAQLFQPYVEELVASGAGHVWHAAADRGRTAYTTLVTRRPLLVSHREELLSMTRAMARTLRWIATTRGIDVARTLAEYFPDLAPEIFAAAIDRYRAHGLFASDPVLRREGFDRLQAAMLSGGAIAREIPYADCVDNSLAERTLRSLGG